MTDSADGEIIEASNPGVKQVAKQWSVLEDGALAYQLQKEENVTHYSGNISRRRTVRTDREVAKDVAKEAALEAFEEEHKIAMRNRQLEEEDAERARLLQIQMIKEEQEKALQAQETDEMLARRLQHEEKKRLEMERRKRLQEEQMHRDERLARRLSQQNGEPYYQHSGKHRTKTDKIDESMRSMSLDESGRRSSRNEHGHGHGHAHGHTHSHTHSLPTASGGGDRPLTVAMEKEPVDSDEESDAQAELSHDEAYARRMQKEEVKKARHRSLSEEQHRQLLHDEKIARKMQHEEVMMAKKKTHDKYRRRVSNEIADPQPMVHVSKERKVPVLAEAKESNGVTLTDVTPTATGKESPPPGDKPNGGNILASIDPTYNPRASTGVILTKRTPIGDAAPPAEPPPHPSNGTNPSGKTPPDNFAIVQGTRRTSGKEKEKKKGSFFSKLKKK